MDVAAEGQSHRARGAQRVVQTLELEQLERTLPEMALPTPEEAVEVSGQEPQLEETVAPASSSCRTRPRKPQTTPAAVPLAQAAAIRFVHTRRTAHSSYWEGPPKAQRITLASTMDHFAPIRIRPPP